MPGMGKRTDAQRFIAHLCHIGSRFLRRQAAGYIRKFIHTGEEPPLRPSRNRNRIAIADKEYRPLFNPPGSIFNSDRKLRRYALPECFAVPGNRTVRTLWLRSRRTHQRAEFNHCLGKCPGLKISVCFTAVPGAPGAVDPKPAAFAGFFMLQIGKKRGKLSAVMRANTRRTFPSTAAAGT